MITRYNDMKIHFDRLLLGTHTNSYFKGAEPIRLTYNKAFGKQINFYEVHETFLRIDSNPFIKSIITLIGPEDDQRDLPEGMMMTEFGVSSVNIMTNEIYRGVSSSNVKSYTDSVYYAMDNIIQTDVFYKPEYIAKFNPMMKVIRMLPFYFTYYHIRDCAPTYFDSENFRTYLEKYLINGQESIDKLLNHLIERRYSDDLYTIYNVMTVNGEIEDDILN